jgi:hypothetical protein
MCKVVCIHEGVHILHFALKCMDSVFVTIFCKPHTPGVVRIII